MPCNVMSLVVDVDVDVDGDGDVDVDAMCAEMDPSSADLGFLAASNKAVYVAMASADPNATYVMQVLCGTFLPSTDRCRGICPVCVACAYASVALACVLLPCVLFVRMVCAMQGWLFFSAHSFWTPAWYVHFVSLCTDTTSSTQ